MTQRIGARQQRLLQEAFPSHEEKRALEIEKAATDVEEAFSQMEFDASTSELDRQGVRLKMLRDRVAPLDPQLSAQLNSQLMQHEALQLERKRVMGADDREIETHLEALQNLQLERDMLRRKVESGISGDWGRWRNPKTGETLEFRPDDPVLDKVAELGWEYTGTAGERLSAAAAAARGNKLGKTTDSQMRAIKGSTKIINILDNMSAALSDPEIPAETGPIYSVQGLRTMIARWFGDPLGNQNYETFVLNSDQLRPLFQELAAGNPSVSENQYFSRASPNPIIVAERVCWKSQMFRAKPLIPEARMDMIWPIQTMMNPNMPDGRFDVFSMKLLERTLDYSM